MPDIREEISDILNLSRMVNSDAAHVNSKVNQDLRVNIIDPKKAVQELIEKAKASGVDSTQQAMAAMREQQQRMVQTKDGVAVTAPISLIPMPEGYNMPQMQPTALVPSQVVEQPKPNQQLEFDLKPSNGFNPMDEFRDIKYILNIINKKLTDLVDLEKVKYERRNKRKNMAEGSNGSSNVLPI